MGYETKYTVTASESIADLDQKLAEVSDYSFEDGYLNAKWYDHQGSMVALSKKHPWIIFTLHGVVEDSGDMWVKYYLNGKSQEVKAKITYEPFDESKLE